MTQDPVCGMQVDENSAQHKSEHRGQTQYFCSEGCKQEFDAEPDRYAGSREQRSA